ncbi:pilin [Neisseria animalis]|uniref:Prepilin-type N-terminal cleavage/methylation domain-containing protein n=1 Tax=Neisseria animalis TaxID=492 RepID=A0A5P3MTQ9_NEIAN|nr:pilin [Neisseria animalis]QEY24997.1 prepilin-type N-terminal cleavage/methylation domain-containing protein [Neisseria animalis]ROW32704.1 prepilin-type N-terminal cleavage/methylation domain-containing protein [Neisseria animalis]VEE06258.1 class II pilin PilE [Neisseria animalis]
MIFRKCGKHAGKAYGFSVLELVIVLTILGVFAAVAIPVYQIYVARAQVNEALTALAVLRRQVDQNYAETSRDYIDIQPEAFNSRFIKGVRIQNGNSIAAEFSDEAAEPLRRKSLVFVAEYPNKVTPQAAAFSLMAAAEEPPVSPQDKIRWTCESELDDVYLPSVCKSGQR